MTRVPAPGRLAPRVSMLTDDAFAYLHEQTLELLATVGVRFAGARARALLREAGARVDDEARVVRIPPSSSSGPWRRRPTTCCWPPATASTTPCSIARAPSSGTTAWER